MAVILETKQWLVGWHAMNTGSLLNDAVAFGDYVSKVGAAKSVRLYGVTHASRNSMAQQKTELRNIAARMKYEGRISCFLMPVRRHPQNDLVMFRRRGQGEKCVVTYVDQQQASHDERQVDPAQTPHRIILNSAVSPLVTKTFSDVQQKMVTSDTSPVRVSSGFRLSQLMTIRDKDWTSFSA